MLLLRVIEMYKYLAIVILEDYSFFKTMITANTKKEAEFSVKRRYEKRGVTNITLVVVIEFSFLKEIVHGN